MNRLRWPPDQLFIDEAERARVAERCRDRFLARCRELRIDGDLSFLLPTLYVPLAAWLAEHRRRAQQTLVVGLCGGQGSGKSTVTRLLRVVLGDGLGLAAASFSIDDLYKTREDRQALARSTHPLFATRGVPRTHDIALGLETIAAIKRLGPGETLALPSFDKSIDDRRPAAQWPLCVGPVDILLFEGWCVGARPQAEAALGPPVNRLERDEDADGRWRHYVNHALQGGYQRLFGMLDVLILLKVPDMDRVFAWRRLQEHKLAESVAAAGRTDELAIMSDAEVERFVMHYERLTRHILAEMPGRADIAFSVDETHNPAAVTVNKKL